MKIGQTEKKDKETKNNGMVTTGTSLKTISSYGDPRTVEMKQLKNYLLKNTNIDTSPPILNNHRGLYNKLTHSISNGTLKEICHFKNKENTAKMALNNLSVKSNIRNDKPNNGIAIHEKTRLFLDRTKDKNSNTDTNVMNRKYNFSKQAISNLSPGDQMLFEKFGQGSIKSVPYACIHHAFEKHALSQPNTVAARHLCDSTSSVSITYGELNLHANRLAALLQKHGVKKGDNVALFLHRSIAMLVGILAIHKLGAAYVPQHVGIAAENQLTHIIKTASTRIVLTLTKLKHLIPVPAGYVCLAIDEVMHKPLKHEDNKNPVVDVEHKDLCFILFTSGTTDVPNGVQVTHGNICNIILTKPGNLGIKPGMKVAQILNIAFDMAAWEIHSCLAHGATLIIRGENIQQAAGQADVVIATPSILASIKPEFCQNIKVVAVAGEPCPKPLADSWSSFCKFYNACGPTETTIVNTMQHYHSACKQLTIGNPTPNNTVYILDKTMKPCTIGEVGEMWAGGACVTSFYLDNPKLNKERYVPDPFLADGRVMFRTKDLGRWTTNGELEHFGRIDDQVKIRGFRVELDSVSSVLEKVPFCTQAVTLKLDNSNLVAFVRPKIVDVKVAKQIVSNSLPYYCTPSKIIAMDELPKTKRGKIDKRTLSKLFYTINNSTS